MAASAAIQQRESLAPNTALIGQTTRQEAPTSTLRVGDTRRSRTGQGRLLQNPCCSGIITEPHIMFQL